MKKFLIIKLFLVFSLQSFAQVRLQTGSAEISIPVHGFSDNLSRLKFNLSINYSSGSGLKVDELPGPLGANWQLEGIPKIVRIQKGLPDDQDIGSNKPSGITFQYKFVSLRGCPKIMNYYPISDEEITTYDDALISSNDKSVDEFQVFLNGRLITFYLRTRFGLSQDRGVAVQILNSRDEARIIAYTDMPPNDNIPCKTKITRFEILDNDGLAYIFSRREYAKLYNYEVPGNKYYAINNPNGFDKAQLICRQVKNELNDSHIVSAWSITKIIDHKNQREINFNYAIQTLEFENYTNLYASGDNSSYPNPINNSGIYSVFVTLMKNKVITAQIKDVTFPTGEKIEFLYENNERKDLKGAYALKDIIIKNNNQERFAKINLNQSYFVKNEVKIPANTTEAKWSRLCLTGIQKFGESDNSKEPSSEFTYFLGNDNHENFVPPVFFHAKDPWGYYNGNYCQVSVNDFISKASTSLADWRRLSTNGNYHYVNSEEEILGNSKSEYASNGLLKTYTSPSGQFIEYEYKQNEAKFGQYNRRVGGVHVSKVSTRYRLPDDKQIIEYSYTLPDGSSSLWGVEQPRCVSKITRHYKAEKKGLSYKIKYPAIYQGLELSEGVSGYNFLRFLLDRGIAILNTIMTIQNPTPMGIVYVIGNYLFEIINGLFNSHEETITQYYFHQDPLNFSNPLPAQFSRVIVSGSSSGSSGTISNGRTEYEFTSDIDFPPLLPILKPDDPDFNPHFFSQSQRSHSWMYGLPKTIKIFKNDGTNPVKEINNFYENVLSNSNTDITLTSCNCQPVYFDSKNESDYYTLSNDIDVNFTNTTIPDKLYIDYLYVHAGYPQLKKTIETNYSSNDIKNIVDYEYNSNGFLSSQKSIDSKGKEFIKKIYYHNDFYQDNIRPNNIFTHLFEQNRGNIPIATETWQLNPLNQTEELISSNIFEFSAVTNGDYKLVNEYLFESDLPISKNSIYEFSYTSPPPLVRNSTYFKLKNQINYNEQGLAIQFNNIEQNKRNGVIFGYDQQYVISKFINAGANEVAYTSFETSEKNNWEYDASGIVSNVPGITGTKCFQLDWDYYKAVRLSYNMPQQTTKPYTLSFWANESTVAVGGNMVSPLENKSINGWYFFKIDFATGSNAPLINGGSLIDELRWYPKDARMETYSYNTFGNQNSLCDANNNIAYYNYDELGRLVFVRDIYNNILKTYCFNIYGQTENCNVGYTNDLQQETFTSHASCLLPGAIPPTYTHTVPAGSFTSFIDKADANRLAISSLNSIGQTTADALPCKTHNIYLSNNSGYTGYMFSMYIDNVLYNFPANGVLNTLTVTLPAGNHTFKFPCGSTSNFAMSPNNRPLPVSICNTEFVLAVNEDITFGFYPVYSVTCSAVNADNPLSISGFCNSGNAGTMSVYSSTKIIEPGSTLYYDAAKTQPVNNMKWIRPWSGNGKTIYAINSSGNIQSTTYSQSCP